MFSLEEIKDAHRATVKTGADFPGYIQKLIALGVLRYETFVSDGHTVYYGANNHQPATAASYPALQIDTSGNENEFKERLLLHQQGKTDYPTFCRDAAACGVFKWVVDTNRMTCTYYNTQGNAVLAENIPVLK